MSPASPEKATSVCLLSDLVLSSEALRIVAPRIAALEAAIKVKSLPVIPNKTSLVRIMSAHFIGNPHRIWKLTCWDIYQAIMILFGKVIEEVERAIVQESTSVNACYSYADAQGSYSLISSPANLELYRLINVPSRTLEVSISHTISRPCTR